MREPILRQFPDAISQSPNIDAYLKKLMIFTSRMLITRCQ